MVPDVNNPSPSIDPSSFKKYSHAKDRQDTDQATRGVPQISEGAYSITPLTEDLSVLTTQFSNEFVENMRIVFNNATREAVTIDPGGEGARFLEMARQLDIDIKAILLTHSHLDHCGGVKELKDALDVPLYGSKLNSESLMRQAVELLRDEYWPNELSMRNCPEVDHALRDGETLSLAGINFTAMATPGHSDGHFAFLTEFEGNHTLFSGDLVFANSVAPTGSPCGPFEELLGTLEQVLKDLPSETISMAGHGRNKYLRDWPAVIEKWKIKKKL